MMRTLLLRSIQAALYAGVRILQIYNTDFRVWHKHDKSPLTAADCYAHETIVALLQPTQIPILSEEGKLIPYETRRNWDVFWMVDPLDGTKEFIAKNGEFTVNIALIRKQEPILGVIYAPCMNMLYFTDNNQVAYKLDIDFQMANPRDKGHFDVFDREFSRHFSHCKRLPLQQPFNRPYTIIGSRSHDTRRLQIYLRERKEVIKDIAHLSIGSSLKFCVVAEGLADEYPRIGPTMEWDTAAGHAIAKCSGAQIVQAETGLPLLYNKTSLKNPNFIVKRGRHHIAQQSVSS